MIFPFRRNSAAATNPTANKPAKVKQSGPMVMTKDAQGHFVPSEYVAGQSTSSLKTSGVFAIWKAKRAAAAAAKKGDASAPAVPPQ